MLFLIVRPSYAVNLTNTALFGLGFASGTVFHEVGHASVALLQGGDIVSFQFSKVLVKYDDALSQAEFNQKCRAMVLGGYIAQSLASEVILQNEQWHNNEFALGWMSLGLLVNLSNPIRYYIFNQHNNDLGTYKRMGGDPLLPSMLMLAHAGFTLYRLFSETDVPVYLGQNMIGIRMKF
ncbi:MAG: hypothetical protein CL521_05885 [Actinobacteria bacterium]|nr:hypothetical protein [Actinomycetota bacterium]